MATPSENVTNGQSTGRVVQIIGPVVDVEFEEKHLPPIYQALRIVSEGFDVPTPIDVIAEVQQHLGEGRVRTVSMVATDGMVRGMKAIDTGGRLRSGGEGTLGRILTLLVNRWIRSASRLYGALSYSSHAPFRRTIDRAAEFETGIKSST